MDSNSDSEWCLFEECYVSRFQMLYCDSVGCRVNEFEHGDDGMCPGCRLHGELIL